MRYHSDRAGIVFGCRTAKRSGHDAIDHETESRTVKLFIAYALVVIGVPIFIGLSFRCY